MGPAASSYMQGSVETGAPAMHALRTAMPRLPAPRATQPGYSTTAVRVQWALRERLIGPVEPLVLWALPHADGTPHASGGDGGGPDEQCTDWLCMKLHSTAWLQSGHGTVRNGAHVSRSSVHRRKICASSRLRSESARRPTTSPRHARSTAPRPTVLR